MYNNNCLYLICILLFNTKTINVFGDKVQRKFYSSDLEELFRTKISDIAVKTSQLCNLPLETKLAICDTVIFNKEEDCNSMADSKICLNKTASSLVSSDCIIGSIILLSHENNSELDIDIPQQHILQCYGRFNPVRTSWLEDAAFSLIYMVAGPNDLSFIALGRFPKTTKENLYMPLFMIELTNFIEFPAIKINRSDINDELRLLRTVKRSNYQFQNEFMYLRERNKSNLEEYDPVCNLKTRNKILLCQKILSFSNLWIIDRWLLDVDAFNDNSSQCVQQKLHINKILIQNGEIIYKKMYPCYGKESYTAIPWYLSAGYRENSIMLYMPHNEGFYTLAEFYENFYLENLDTLVVE